MRRRDERGAVTIMIAMLALVLVGVAALTVDLGKAFVQKRDIQKQTDFSVLAGAAGDNLPMTAAGSVCSITTPGSYGGIAARPTDQAIIDTASYLSDVPGAGTITPAQLTDCQLGNGEAVYGMFTRDAAGVHLVANPNQLSVLSQPKNVKFGLAGALGYTNVDVSGQATVEIKTPLIRTLPLYAFTGCDYGTQTISQPTNGHSSSGVNLSHSTGSEGKNTLITESALTLNPTSNTDPPSVALGAIGATVTITGTHLDTVTAVGFFRSAATNPPEPIQVTTGFTLSGTTQLTIDIPTTVTGIQDTWFIRLYGPSATGGNPKPDWTPVVQNGNNDPSTNLAALPIVVGNATLNCAQGSSQGNFGTILVPNSSPGAPNGQSDNIAYNIAVGIQFGLAPFPADKRTPPDYTCVAGQPGAVLWPAEGTNCVDTKTGLESNAAEEGLVTGVAGKPGLLRDVSAADQCPNDYPAHTTHQTVTPTGFTINNDILSCYFTNNTVTVGDVSTAGYAGGTVLNQAIYRSPRFVQVPVLGREPASGGSFKYEIVDFRPAFITDQATTDTRLTGVPTSGNGIVWTPNKKLQAVVVTFINPKALPNPPIDQNGNYIPYAGSGKKVPLLVN